MLKYFNILKANGEIKSLTEKNSEMTALIEQLRAEVETLKQTQASFSMGAQDWATEKENLIKGNEQAINDLKTQYEKQIEDLKNSVNTEQVSASEKAVEIVASLGLEPETIKVTSEELVGKSVNKSRYTVTTRN